MKEQLKRVLQYITPDLTEQELETIAGCFKAEVVNKNVILLSEGDTCTSFYYVQKGCIRTYYLAKNGEEKTRYIMPEQHIGTALTSFIHQQPSFEAIDAFEQTELFSISRHDFYRLQKEIPAWKEFYIKMLEMAYAFQNRKIESIVTLSAKQRYDELLKKSPSLMQRVSNKVLASYLDIRQETLSRLKSRN